MINKPTTPRTTARITKPNGDQRTDPSEKAKILLEQFCPTEQEDRKDNRTKLYEQKIQEATQRNGTRDQPHRTTQQGNRKRQDTQRNA